MHRRSYVHLTVPLPQSEYRPFVFAIRRLRRIMGAKAPDVITLIQANLRERDARGLAEDYLDGIGWPLAERRERSQGAGGGRKRPAVLLRRPREVEKCLRLPADPSRN